MCALPISFLTAKECERFLYTGFLVVRVVAFLQISFVRSRSELLAKAKIRDPPNFSVVLRLQLLAVVHNVICDFVVKTLECVYALRIRTRVCRCIDDVFVFLSEPMRA